MERGYIHKDNFNSGPWTLNKGGGKQRHEGIVEWWIFFKFYLFLYLFLAALGLSFCARAFSSCGKQGPLFIVVRGPLTIAASLVVEHRLQTRRLSSCGSRA